MPKNSYMRYIVLIIASITSMIIVLFLLLDTGKKMEYILSVLSISVTLILGVTTYCQVETQKKIDMMDKTPSMKCKFIKDEEVKADSEQNIIRKEIALYSNKEYCCAENFAGSTVDALLRLDLVNNSKVVIQRVEFFEQINQQGEETETKLLNYRAEVAINDNINNPQAQFLKSLNDKREPGVYWNVDPNEEIQVYLIVPFNASEIEKKLVLDIKTLQGYKYTETIHICAQNCGFMPSKGIMYLVNSCEISVERQK